MSNIRNEIGGIIKDPNPSSILGEGLKTFKSEIEEKISGLSNLISRSDSLASEFHKKTDKSSSRDGMILNKRFFDMKCLKHELGFRAIFLII